MADSEGIGKGNLDFKRLLEVGKMVGIWLIDHIIIRKDKYFSFQAEGMLKGGNKCQ